ncbi:MAG: UDP-3-O-(3-hydroxymyristoyl)glucosamine N-acyltransferase [bacterium]|nr:UDP-3-O-(3-hydroxymyristoyl)glucosamine N-acyltransferase [bacterium]
MTKLSIAEIAAIISGEIAPESDNAGSIYISNIKPLESAIEGDLSFFAPKARKQYRAMLQLASNSPATAIITAKYYEEIATTQIIVANPMAAIITLSHRLARKQSSTPGIHQLAFVDPSACIAQSASIAPFCFVGKNVSIGENTILHSHSVVYDGATIGQNCELHAHSVVREYSILGDDCNLQPGAIVGGDGFGYIYNKDSGYQRIPHIGITVLENHVDLGANATVDRAMLGETRIGSGSKLDNLVMIGHNVEVGTRTIMCAQVGVSGSTKIGSGVTLAGKVGVADHITVGNGVRAAAMSGIAGDIPENTEVGGYPAVPAAEWRRTCVALRRLPELFTARRTSEENQSLEESNTSQ